MEEEGLRPNHTPLEGAFFLSFFCLSVSLRQVHIPSASGKLKIIQIYKQKKQKPKTKEKKTLSYNRWLHQEVMRPVPERVTAKAEPVRVLIKLFWLQTLSGHLKERKGKRDFLEGE